MVVPASPIAGSRSGKDAFGTLCQGRLGLLASYTWTWESMIVIGEAPLCDVSLAVQQVRVQRAQASCVADAGGHERQLPTAAIVYLAQGAGARWIQVLPLMYRC